MLASQLLLLALFEHYYDCYYNNKLFSDSKLEHKFISGFFCDIIVCSVIALIGLVSHIMKILIFTVANDFYIYLNIPSQILF